MLLQPVAESGYLIGRGESLIEGYVITLSHWKGTLQGIISWFICSQEGTTLCFVHWKGTLDLSYFHSRMHFIEFCFFIVICPLEGQLEVTLLHFVYWKGTTEGTWPYFVQWKKIIEGTVLHFSCWKCTIEAFICLCWVKGQILMYFSVGHLP